MIGPGNNGWTAGKLSENTKIIIIGLVVIIRIIKIRNVLDFYGCRESLLIFETTSSIRLYRDSKTD